MEFQLNVGVVYVVCFPFQGAISDGTVGSVFQDGISKGSGNLVSQLVLVEHMVIPILIQDIQA